MNRAPTSHTSVFVGADLYSTCSIKLLHIVEYSDENCYKKETIHDGQAADATRTSLWCHSNSKRMILGLELSLQQKCNQICFSLSTKLRVPGWGSLRKVAAPLFASQYRLSRTAGAPRDARPISQNLRIFVLSRQETSSGVFCIARDRSWGQRRDEPLRAVFSIWVVTRRTKVKCTYIVLGLNYSIPMTWTVGKNSPAHEVFSLCTRCRSYAFVPRSELNCSVSLFLVQWHQKRAICKQKVRVLLHLLFSLTFRPKFNCRANFEFGSGHLIKELLAPSQNVDDASIDKRAFGRYLP